MIHGRIKNFISSLPFFHDLEDLTTLTTSWPWGPYHTDTEMSIHCHLQINPYTCHDTSLNYTCLTLSEISEKSAWEHTYSTLYSIRSTHLTGYRNPWMRPWQICWGNLPLKGRESVRLDIFDRRVISLNPIICSQLNSRAYILTSALTSTWRREQWTLRNQYAAHPFWLAVSESG